MVLQRVKRAKEQRRDLEREMRTWVKEGAYRVVSKFDSETGYTLFYLEQSLDIPPEITSLIAETLHSLRSALDNLAYQLFLLRRADPLHEGEHVYFPIYDDTEPSKSDPFRRIKPLGEDVVKVFRTINPCKSGNPLLWALHRLDIVDKHRRVLTSTLVHHSIFVQDAMKQLVINGGDADILPFVPLPPAFMPSAKTGKTAQVGHIVFVGMPGDEEVNKKLKFTFDVAFDEPGIIEGRSIVETLDKMIPLVDGIISSLSPFLI
jgi:hypothetical protein